MTFPTYNNGTAKIPKKSAFAFSFSSSETLVTKAVNQLESYLDNPKKCRDINSKIDYMNSTYFSINSKLETAVRKGDSSPNTLLLLGTSYILLGEWAKASKVCAALADKAIVNGSANLVDKAPVDKETVIDKEYAHRAHLFSAVLFRKIGAATGTNGDKEKYCNLQADLSEQEANKIKIDTPVPKVFDTLFSMSN
ncbi:MAG: hypothetical protein NT051_02575 [Candidatus Micrarchaeota archaeon]|nr:hypothetical protein [Candidatus Micrarchaeota archaeon]